MDQPKSNGTNSNNGSLSKAVAMSGGEEEPRAKNLSERAEKVVARSSSPYYAGWKEVARNPYDKTTNPEGCIQLGLAENMVRASHSGYL